MNVSGGFTPTGPIIVQRRHGEFTATVNGTGSATFTSLNVNGGTFTGAATITVTGARPGPPASSAARATLTSSAL